MRDARSTRWLTAAVAGAIVVATIACGGATLDDGSTPDDGGGENTFGDGGADAVDDALASGDATMFDAGSDTGAIGDASVGRTCTPSSCASGCCDANDRCVMGTSGNACGFGGQACVDCAAQGLACVASDGGAAGGTCAVLDAGTSCGPTSCAGCCAQGACVDGASAAACGSHGLGCAACTASNEQCVTIVGGGGACIGSSQTCNPTNCDGCCDATGVCRVPSEIGACGSGGLACRYCTPGEACLSGTCQAVPGCGPLNCVGCCSGSSCLSGVDGRQCGASGATCVDCAATQMGGCAPNGQKAGGHCSTSEGCGPGDCSNGCCGFAYQCQPGTSGTYCGNDGGFCTTCSGSCANGVCQGTACPSSCSGCCMPDGTCWNGAKDGAHCGWDGVLCFDCGPGYACADPGVCIPLCGPQNCNGCCNGSACEVGNVGSACGAGGVACGACGTNQTCTMGQCEQPFVCNTSTCAGCCTTTGFCALGSEDARCGAGGHACSDCTASNKTCSDGQCGP